MSEKKDPRGEGLGTAGDEPGHYDAANDTGEPALDAQPADRFTFDDRVGNPTLLTRPHRTTAMSTGFGINQRIADRLLQEGRIELGDHRAVVARADTAHPLPDARGIDAFVAAATARGPDAAAIRHAIHHGLARALEGAPTLLARLADYPEALMEAAQELAPHQVAFYLRDLAAEFHAFYNAERVLVDDAALRDARLALLLAARQVLRNALGVLGVAAPESMVRESASDTGVVPAAEVRQ